MNEKRKAQGRVWVGVVVVCVKAPWNLAAFERGKRRPRGRVGIGDGGGGG